MSALINRAAVRRLALDVANRRRESKGLPPKFRRVGKAFLVEIETATRLAVTQRAEAHWQKGKTLQ